MTLPKRDNKKQAKDYQQLGEILVNIYESGYLDRNQAYKSSFIKGALGGIGGVVGATVGIALLLWILSLFQNVPLVGHFVDQVKTTVQTRNH